MQDAFPGGLTRMDLLLSAGLLILVVKCGCCFVDVVPSADLLLVVFDLLPVVLDARHCNLLAACR